MRWLTEFSNSRRGKTFTWTATDYVKAVDGGGRDGVLHVDAGGLVAHRERIGKAERDGDGKPVSVSYEGIPFEAMITNDICFCLVKPATGAGKCSYARKLLDEGRSGTVRDATVFVSHAWKYVFVDVVEALRELPEDAYVWFDVFTVNQHASQLVPPDWWYTTFKDAVAGIGHTALVLMPWKDPIPLTRAWCIWEILCTIDKGAAKLDIRLPAHEQKAFADFLMRSDDGPRDVIKAMLEIDVERAQARNPEDLINILNAVRNCDGGASAVNKCIKDQMRSWILEAGVAALEGLSTRSRATSHLLCDVAELFMDQGKYNDAEKLYRESVAGRRQTLGDASHKTLVAVDGLARVLVRLGQHSEAEPLMREVLKGVRRIDGDAHPNTIGSMANLAVALEAQGKNGDAAELMSEALDAMRQVHGNGHPKTLEFSLNILFKHGKYADAEKILHEAVATNRRTLGNAHPHTISSINNLAIVLSKQRKFAEAEPYYCEALKSSRRELGDEHPDTLHRIDALAVLRSDQGRNEDAEPLFRQVLTTRRRVLGESHDDTLSAIAHLALCLKKQEKYKEAEPLYQEALKVKLRKFGDENSDTLDLKRDLALALTHQGKYKAAEPIYNMLSSAPNAFFAFGNLPDLLTKQGRHDYAEKLFRDAMNFRERAHLKADPNLMTGLTNVLSKQGKGDAAVMAYREAIEKSKREFGDKHIKTVMLIHNLSAELRRQGKVEEANSMQAIALANAG